MLSAVEQGFHPAKTKVNASDVQKVQLVVKLFNDCAEKDYVESQLKELGYGFSLPVDIDTDSLYSEFVLAALGDMPAHILGVKGLLEEMSKKNVVNAVSFLPK